MKNYFYILVFTIFFMVPLSGFSQVAESYKSDDTTIAGLSIYPNPVSNGKIYITTTKNLTKDIEIFDVLGKKIHSSSLFGNELNVSKLTPGIYILKIKENNISATRKLVVR